jgi:hypothetical protein
MIPHYPLGESLIHSRLSESPTSLVRRGKLWEMSIETGSQEETSLHIREWVVRTGEDPEKRLSSMSFLMVRLPKRSLSQPP